MLESFYFSCIDALCVLDIGIVIFCVGHDLHKTIYSVAAFCGRIEDTGFSERKRCLFRFELKRKHWKRLLFTMEKCFTFTFYVYVSRLRFTFTFAPTFYVDASRLRLALARPGWGWIFTRWDQHCPTRCCLIFRDCLHIVFGFCGCSNVFVQLIVVYPPYKTSFFGGPHGSR